MDYTSRQSVMDYTSRQFVKDFTSRQSFTDYTSKQAVMDYTSRQFVIDCRSRLSVMDYTSRPYAYGLQSGTEKRDGRNNIKTEVAGVIILKQEINRKVQMEIINQKYNTPNPPL